MTAVPALVCASVLTSETHARGLDRDAALPFERERVRLRRTRVDAADVANDAGLVQQPFCESCLTGVYVRQDSEVELFPFRHPPFPPWGPRRPCGRTWLYASVGNSRSLRTRVLRQPLRRTPTLAGRAVSVHGGLLLERRDSALLPVDRLPRRPGAGDPNDRGRQPSPS
jgi:hypothetical protein